MKHFGALLAVALFLVWFIWNLLNLHHLVKDARDGSRLGPMWWVRLGSVSLCAGFVSWVWGLLSGGLDPEDTCQFARHQTYDDAYRQAHADEPYRLFPLHNKCNAHYDLVPSWVNPVVAACAVVCLVAVAVLLWQGVTHLTRSPLRKERLD